MKEVLVYINKVSDNPDGVHEYDFVFSNTPEYVWGNDWDSYNPSSCEDTFPDETTYSKIYKARTVYPLKTIQETTCLPIEYAIYGITALAWIDIENLEEYPQNGRMVFHFGDDKEKVEELLSKYDYTLDEK